METIFGDECGYTGQDLLQPEQPVFVEATIKISEEQSKGYHEEFFSKIQAKELKHKKLSKRPKQQEMVLRFLDSIIKDSVQIDVLIMHKPYALLGKFVDLVVEPIMKITGHDLLSEGENLALTNLLWMVLPVFTSENFFNEFLVNFQKLVRERTPEAYEDFFRPLLSRKYPRQLDILITPVMLSNSLLNTSILSDLEDGLKVMITCYFTLLARWNNKVDKDITLVLDRSSEVAQDYKTWEALMNPYNKPVSIGTGNRNTTFPMKVKETSLEDSCDWCGLQLADIIAGATTRYAHWILNGQNAEDEYAVKLGELIINNIIEPAWKLWPSDKMTPEEMGTERYNGNEAIEQIGKIIDDND
ncbi:MAG: hypothetical protein E3J72_12250 [Planctomycetota bacterium]|nr:MAG: hypothetical protein E3J72_12250 [Planctomycetota bacterium]